MKSTLDRILAGLMVVLVAALGWVVSGSLEEPVTKVGDKAPAFSLKTDDGKTLSPTNFGGKLLVLNFWAAWCQPCVDEVPSLEAFKKEFESQGVVVLGVSVDANQALYDRFKQQFGVTFATARDGEWDLAAKYGTFQLPETYIIDSNGRVIQKIVAAQNWMDPNWLATFRRLL